MPGPKVVYVDVSIDDPFANPPEFRVEPSPASKGHLPTKPNPGKPGQPEIIFSNKGNKGFEIHFVLQGDTQGYFFPAIATDAVWSQRGRHCPNVVGVWDVFSPLQVVESGNPPERRTLIVENLNPNVGGGKGQGKFMYNLRVTDGGRTLNLDPPGDNTNGSVKFTRSAMTEIFLAVGAVATVTLIAAALWDRLKGRQ